MSTKKKEKNVGKARRTTKSVQETKTSKELVNEIITKRLRFKALNEVQKNFSKLILDNQIVIAYGPAGTGKSYTSIFKALELLQLKSNNYNKIIIIKPVVESEENLGFLPGTPREKLEPYISSSLSLIDKIIGKKKRIELEELELIEIQALAFMRGINIDNSILIMEEAQNMSKGQMKTLLTRLGSDSKFIISGDLDQSDRYRDVKQSGLYDSKTRLNNMADIGMIEFELKDIVRNPLISKILNRYKPIENKRVIPTVEKNDRVQLNEGVIDKTKIIEREPVLIKENKSKPKKEYKNQILLFLSKKFKW